MAKRPAKKPTRRKSPARTKPPVARHHAALQDRRGQAISEVTAADLKNRTGRVLTEVLSHGAVAITRHRVPHAVLLSLGEYQALLSRAPKPINTLKKEFDALVAKMQTPKAKAGVRAVGKATTADLSRAARNYRQKEGKRGR